jgi:hypothetical protein
VNPVQLYLFRDYEPPGVKIEGIELKEGYTNVCYQIALSPFALAIDIIDKQCQSSEVKLLIKSLPCI